MFKKMSFSFSVIFSTLFTQSLSYSLNQTLHDPFSLNFIYGGNSYTETEHKSVVNGKLDRTKIIEVAIETPGLCGGTIIGDRFILTAAHCFISEEFCYGSDENTLKSSLTPLANIKVYIEGICYNSEGQKCADADIGRLVSAKNLYILEEFYSKNCTSGDLAIIELAEVIGDHGAKLSESIEIPTSGDFMVSGFGVDPENVGHSLKTVTLTAEKCAENYGYYDSICTIEIDKDVCQGDSGGALIDKDSVIIGVVKGGEICSNMLTSVENHKSENSPLKKWNGGVFTSVSKHFGFICDILGSIQGCPKAFIKEPYLTIS